MDIIQEPEHSGIYFQNSIPDIILEKTDANTSIIFEFKKGSESILVEKYAYDADGKINIRNICEIVEKYFKPNISEISDTNIISTGLCNLDFTYVITESNITWSNSFTALKCDANISVYAPTWTTKNFLSRAFQKRTAKGRNEYLSFYKLSGYSTVTINYRITYLNDGVLSEKTGIIDQISDLSADAEVITFNSSIGRVLITAALQLDTVVYQYEIWLTGTGLLTDIFTFLVDNSLYRDHNSFVFINCFGVLETFTATGKISNKKTNEYNLSNIDGHYRKVTQNFVSEKTCNSGYLTDMEMEWIDDLVNSYTVGLYTASDGMSEEITLVSIDKSDSGSNELKTFRFNFRRALNNHLDFAVVAKGIFDDTFDDTFN